MAPQIGANELSCAEGADKARYFGQQYDEKKEGARRELRTRIFWELEVLPFSFDVIAISNAKT